MRWLGLAVLLIVGAAGCSDSADSLDRSATQRAVGRAVAAEVEPKVLATTCPADLPAKQGARFTCEVRLGGDAGILAVRVRQVDEDGRLEVEPAAAVLSDAAIARALKRELADRFSRSFQVDCGDQGPAVRPAESVLACTARDQTGRRTVDVRIVDAEGTLAFAVRPPKD